jgi:hypothetical protein
MEIYLMDIDKLNDIFKRSNLDEITRKDNIKSEEYGISRGKCVMCGQLTDYVFKKTGEHICVFHIRNNNEALNKRR